MFLYRTGETDSWRAQTKPCVHQDPEERKMTPQDTEPCLPKSVQESLVEAWVGGSLMQSWGNECSNVCMGPFLGDRHYLHYLHHSFSSVPSLSHVRLSETPWTAAGQASLSIMFQNLLKLMSIQPARPSKHLIFGCPLLLPSIFLSIRVFP